MIDRGKPAKFETRFAMNPDMTRRTLLQMAGASSLAAAASAAARAEGTAGGGPTFASCTPKQERLRKAGADVTAVANGIEVDPWGARVRLIRL